MARYNEPPGAEEFAVFPCEVCGNDPGTDCDCPECHVCGYAGRPECYKEHGLRNPTEDAIDAITDYLYGPVEEEDCVPTGYCRACDVEVFRNQTACYLCGGTTKL
jgi:hypothetical protein